MKKVRKTVSLSKNEFDHARTKMIEGGWQRDGDDAGISRYVQELIRADMRRDVELTTSPAAPKANRRGPKRRN